MATRGRTRKQPNTRSAAVFQSRLTERTATLPVSGETVTYVLPDTRQLLARGIVKIPMPLTAMIRKTTAAQKAGTLDAADEIVVNTMINDMLSGLSLEDELIQAALVWPVVVPDDVEPDVEAGQCHLGGIPGQDRSFIADLLESEGVEMSPFRARQTANVGTVQSGGEVDDEAE